MPIKKGDFVKLEYTGRLKETNDVFDTTDEKVAKEAGVYNENAAYKPIVICVGEHHILKGIDEFVEGKELGEYKAEFSPEQAFGKKNPKLLQMIPISMFQEQNIKPVPGLQLNIDGAMGVVKTVSGGRVVIDFNHPLSGKDVVYELKIDEVVTDKKTQIESLIHVLLGLKEPKVKLDGKKAVVSIPGLPPQILDELKKKIEGLVDGVEVEFDTPEPKKTKLSPDDNTSEDSKDQKQANEGDKESEDKAEDKGSKATE